MIPLHLHSGQVTCHRQSAKIKDSKATHKSNRFHYLKINVMERLLTSTCTLDRSDSITGESLASRIVSKKSIRFTKDMLVAVELDTNKLLEDLDDNVLPGVFGAQVDVVLALVRRW